MEPITWPTTTEDAIAQQNELRHRVVLADDPRPVRLIAGVDVGYDLARDLSRAAVVLLEADSLEMVASTVAFLPTPFPYVPGLLSFREAPVILEALSRLPERPDLLMVDGHGIAHPRRLGIASHVGVLTDLPSIGVAKKKLTGYYTEPGPLKGEISPLTHKNELIGTVLRSKDHVKPLFISPGHRIGHDKALEIVKSGLRRHRLPEPTRLADRLSKTK